MRHLFSSPVGSCAPPCAPSFKCNPLAGLDAVGSMLGTLTNAFMVSNTNDTNRQIAENANIYNDEMNKRTNETNKEIANEANKYNKLLQDEQNEWNLQQWNRQNEYNDPSNQVARLKAAGINPYALYASAGGSVPASQLTSAPSQPAVVPQMQQGHPANVAQMVAPQIQMPSLSALRNINAQSDKLANDVSIANAQNEREAAMQPWRLRYTENLAKHEGILGDIAKQQLAYDQASAKYRLGLLMGDMRLQSENFRTMQVQRTNIELQNKLAEVQLAYAPQMNDAQLKQYYATVNQIKANIGLINANTLLTGEQRLHEIEKRTSSILDNEAKGLDNRVKQQMNEVILQTAKEDLLYKKDTNRFFRPWEFYHKSIGRGAQFLPTPNMSYSMVEYYKNGAPPKR